MGGRQVTIKLFTDGTIQAEIHGVKGKKCMDYIRLLEEILEAETVDSDYTAEYFENETLILDDVQLLREET